MSDRFQQHLCTQLDQIRAAGLYKGERIITTPQDAHIKVADGREVLNMCANNYLGLAEHPAVIAAAHAALDRWGYGLASVRFICGTQELHKQLEGCLSEFLGTEDTILYGCCFDANGGLFETLLGAEDAVISDELNHASIIDGVRLCKAQRHRYKNNDMADLEEKLKAASGARFRLIATDGVFSMDGTIANLAGVCDLADKYNALVMVDDSHAVGFMGRTGRGTHEHCGVVGRVDILTGTLCKALGGAQIPFTALVGAANGFTRHCDSTMINDAGNQPSGNIGSDLKWFKLVRRGADFTTYASKDGADWKQIKSVTLPKMPEEFEIGFVHYSIPSATPIVHRAAFDHISVEP